MHFVFGFLLSLIAFHALGIGLYEVVILSLFAGFSALFPDLDCAGSKIRKIADKLVLFIAIIFILLLYCSDWKCLISAEFALRVFALVGAYFVAFTYFSPKHRGITHSLILGAFFSAPVYFVLGEKFALAAFLGYLSHLLADLEIKLI